MKHFTRIGVMGLMVLFLMVEFGFCQNTAEEIFNKGIELAALGKFDEAKVEFETALKVDPFLFPAKNALNIIEDAINQKIKTKTAIYIFKGIGHENKGQWDEAIVEFNEALKLNPSYAPAYNERGIAYALGNSQYNQASSDFTMAIERNPRYAIAYANRGHTYQMKGQYNKAVSDFNMAIEINPLYSEAYRNRGGAYAYKGQYEKAISDYNKAIEINPKDVEAYANRGHAYLSEGQYEKAISDFTNVIEIMNDGYQRCAVIKDCKRYINYSHRG